MLRDARGRTSPHTKGAEERRGRSHICRALSVGSGRFMGGRSLTGILKNKSSLIANEDRHGEIFMGPAIGKLRIINGFAESSIQLELREEMF